MTRRAWLWALWPDFAPAAPAAILPALVGGGVVPSMPPPPGEIELAVGGGRFQVPGASLRELRLRTTMRQQYDFSCGSAALATLLTHHYQHPVNEQQVFNAMFRHGDQALIRKQGFSLLDMQRFLARRGFRADGFHLPLEQLHAAGLPAIVLLNEKGYQQFVVVKGLNGRRVLLGDPASGTRAMGRAAFDAAWVGQLLFVVHGYAGQPLFNTVADWRAAPAAPLAEAVARDAPGLHTLPKFGPGDF